MKNICIEVNNISKSFNDNCVVRQLSFSVKKGEVYGLLGHNGAGKSTTIDCILGLTDTDNGSASILLQDAKKNRTTLFERVGVQLQHSHYQNNIKVREICQELSALYKNPANYETLLEQFQLQKFTNHKVEQLSGGEKQKLSVVLALIPDPEVLFLDELTTGLDVAARREVWNILRKLKDQGMTIFLTTHYMEEAETLCDHILILKQGEKVTEGTVDEVIDKSPYDNLEDAYLWYVGEEALV